MVTSPGAPVKAVDAATLRDWMARGQAVAIDVRPAVMYAAERIPGARSIPTEAFDPARIPAAAGDRIVVLCEIGKSSAQAARRLVDAGRDEVYNLDGGVAAWKQAGLPVESDPGAPLPVIRQVQIVAGGLVLAGSILPAAVSPWFLTLTGLIGAGLLVAGLTGTCGMAAFLMTLPYNRPRSASAS